MQQRYGLKTHPPSRAKWLLLAPCLDQCNREAASKRPVAIISLLKCGALVIKLLIQASARLARSLELVPKKQVIAQYRRGRGSGGGVRGRVVWVRVGGTWTQETTRPARGLGLGCSSKGRSVILSRVRTRHTRCIGPDEVFETALGSSF